MPSPQEETRTLEDLAAAVEAEGHPVDLAGAEFLVGWESAVLRTQDGWIFRFPRLSAESYRRELAVLAALAGTLPVPTPEVVWTGTRQPFAAYRTITGSWGDSQALKSASAETRAATAESLATFLAAMHDRFDASEQAALGLPPEGTGYVAELGSALGTQPDPVRKEIEALLDAYAATDLAQSETAGGESVTLHGDFHFGNMVLDAPTGRLSGIWDFSCVAVGNPAHDLRYFLNDRDGLGELVAEHYTRITGRSLDLVGTRLMGVMENVGDAITERRPLETALAGWRDRIR